VETIQKAEDSCIRKMNDSKVGPKQYIRLVGSRSLVYFLCTRTLPLLLINYYSSKKKKEKVGLRFLYKLLLCLCAHYCACIYVPC
jgi:hypothetical protein